MPCQLKSEQIPEFRERFHFGDGTLEHIAIRYKQASNPTIEFVVSVRDERAKWCNLRLVFEEASEFRFDQTLHYSLVVCGVADDETMIDSLDGQFVFDFHGLTYQNDGRIDMNSIRATSPTCYVVAPRCFWEILPDDEPVPDPMMPRGWAADWRRFAGLIALILGVCAAGWSVYLAINHPGPDFIKLGLFSLVLLTAGYNWCRGRIFQ